MKTNSLQMFALMFAISCLSLLALAQRQVRAQTPTPPETELSEYIKENYTKREAQIPMRDGVKLFASIYEPKDKSQKYPILLNRTPYTVAPYGADKFKTSLGPSELYAKEGYIFVYEDVRGRWASEGEYADVRPQIDNKTKPTDVDESSDTYDTVDYLIKNVQNNSGKVGIYGISYPGFYTSSGIINTHPAIKAASPQAPVSDWFHGDDMHHNGAFFLAQNYDFYAFFGQPRPTPETPETTKIKQFNYGTKDGYKYFKDTMGSLANSDDLYRKNLGVDAAFWNEMMAHPNYDQFWKDRNILPRLKNIKCAVMTVGGWYDNEDLYGALETYKAIEANNPGIYNVLVVGPWFHGGWARSDGDWLGTAYFKQKTAVYYRERLELPFFNHYLKEKGDLGDLKEINFFNTGANKWDFYDKPATGNAKTFYLQANGKLSSDAPTANDKNAFDEYVSDPSKPVPYTKKITINYPREFMTEDQRFVSNRTDVLTYQTDVLTEDTTVAGDIKPTLFAATSGSDADYVVKLIDVFPDDAKYPDYAKLTPEASNGFELSGYQMLLRGEPFRARFRNSFEKPEPMKPNQIAKIAYTMPAIEHTFKKGHRIMVQIQSSWFPLVDRNPQTYVPNIFEAKETDFVKATQRIYRGGANASSITLPIVPTK